MVYHVMAEDWQTEEEIYTCYTFEEASAKAHSLADYYGVNVDLYELKSVKIGEYDVVRHIEIKPSIDSKPTGNYYWDTKGKYQFAAMMED